jgi:transcriptional regulator with PAS, ATPase and Fis domain
MPGIKLTEDAVYMLNSYSWPGNIRQLKNVVEQISVIETDRDIDAVTLQTYLPAERENTPAVINESSSESINERELMYKFLFDMKKDLTELKKLVVEILSNGEDVSLNREQAQMLNRIYDDVPEPRQQLLPPAQSSNGPSVFTSSHEDNEGFEDHEEVEESLSLEDTEKELIKKALQKHKGKRKYAASELGISERTLYRKIKEYNLTD